MSFSTTLHYANLQRYPWGAVPDTCEKRSLTHRILNTFCENKADKMAIIMRVTHDRGMRLDVTLTDAFDPAQEFPYGHDIEKQWGPFNTIGFEHGMMMTRDNFRENKSIFEMYENFIRSDDLQPVNPV